MAAGDRLVEQLSKLRNSRTLIVGIGNTLKADDGIGPLLCEQLSKGRISAETIDAGTVPENYIQRIIRMAPENLLLVDAIDFGAQPGAINIFGADELGSASISTHSVSPLLFLDMIRQSINVEIYVIGVQPASVTLGEGLGVEANSALESLTKLFLELFPPE